MSNELKTIKGRIQNKHGTEADWLKSVYIDGDISKGFVDNPFVPLDGELIIYDPDSINTKKRFKFGDGVTKVTELPFATDELQPKADEALETTNKTVVGAINEVKADIPKWIDTYKEIMPETELTGLDDDGDGINEAFCLTNTLNLVVNDTYTVNYNGIDYETTAAEFITDDGISTIFLGDMYTASDGQVGSEPTGEPFLVQYVGVGIIDPVLSGMVMPLDGATSVKMSISQGTHQRVIDPSQIKDMYYEEGTFKEILATTELIGKDGEFAIVDTLDLVAGTKYIVTYNGVKYETMATTFVDGDIAAIVLGDVYTATDGSIGTESTGEPFIIIYAPDEWSENGFTGMAMPLDGATSMVISITTYGSIHKIPSKYLPDDIIPDSVPYLEEIGTNILPKTTLTLDEGAATLNISKDKIKAGGIYNILYNDVEYNLEAYDVSNGFVDVVIGYSSIFSTPDHKDDAPFCIARIYNPEYIINVGGNILVLPRSDLEEGTFTLEITDGYLPHKLDEKLLPDIVATENYVDNSINALYGKPSEGLEYTLHNDGLSYEVTGIGTCTDTDIIIPRIYEGKPVTSIDAHAFDGCASLTSIVIPNSVTMIGIKAFSGCSNLTNVVIPGSVTSIDSYAFVGCTSLTNVVIPGSVTSIGRGAFSPNTIHLYCEAESQPEGWYTEWNVYGCPVTWGFAGDFISVNERIDNIEIPTKTSQLTNDSGFLTKHQSLAGLATEEYVSDEIAEHNTSDSAHSDIRNAIPIVSAWALASSKPVYTASEVGALPEDTPLFSGSYDDLTHKPTIPSINGLATEEYVEDNYIPNTQRGAVNGIATLDASGKVPTAQLPSYVDDVLEYSAKSYFPATGESGKIYVAKDTNLTYRWSGSKYVEISASLALGENEATAYRGDRGKIAYDHSQKTSGNPHKVTKSDIGLGNVDNTADAKKTVAKAGQLTTARNISLSGGVTGTATAFNGTQNISIPVTDIKESYVSWGGKVINSGMSVFDTTCLSNTNNCFVGIPSANTTVEISRDNGDTWTKKTLSTDQIAKLFDPNLGNAGAISLSKPYSVNDKVRITIVDFPYSFSWVKLLCNMYLIGLEASMDIQITHTNNQKYSYNYTIAGNWNSLPITPYDFTIKSLCLTISITKVQEHNNPGFSVYNICGLGQNISSNAPALAKSGHLYSYDGNQNATFPAKVSATELIEGGTTLASKYAAKSDIPSKTSQLANDSGFLTSIPSEYVTETELANKKYLTSVPSEYAKKTDLDGLATEEYVNNLLYGKPSEGLTYALNSDGLSYMLSGIGSCTDTDIVIPRTYNDKPVTSIGNSAFNGCSSLTSIIIPSSVTSIDGHAFNNCTNLTSIEIPNSVISIGNQAFSGCTSLTSIEIPNSVTSIGVSAFSDCSSLTSVVIPNSVTSIGNTAFSDCTSLTSVEIPNSVTNMGHTVFTGCASLTSIVIPNSVTGIGAQAFKNCSNLTHIEIPNSVISIGNQAFSGCTNLTNITIPNSVTSIGNYTFYPNTIHLYCEAESKPDGWGANWNGYSCPVTWGFAGDFISVNEKINGLATTDYVDTKIAENDFSIPLDEHNTDTTAHDDIRKKIVGEKTEGMEFTVTTNGVTETVIGGTGAERFNNYTNVASGDYSHAEGNNTIASGANSHAEGYMTTASGDYSHAEGCLTIASGAYSHAEGITTIAASVFQHVQGKANIKDTEGKYAHIVGNGSAILSPSNAHTLDWDGVAWFAGDVKVGGTGQDDENAKTLATTEQIDAALDSKVSTFTVDTNPSTVMREIITTIEEEGGDITALNVVNLTGYLSSTLETRFSHAGGSLYNISCALPLEVAAIGKNTFDVETTTIRDYLSLAISFEEATSKQTYVGYRELVALRDNSQLIPGMYYRITDYECTTAQENTRAMTNQFDIIVQALSSNTLSEIAKADYHWETKKIGTYTLMPSVVAADNALVEGSVTPYYYEYIDIFNEGLKEYKEQDVFIAYDYLKNNEGVTVPVIYKTDEAGLGEEPNYDFEGPDYEDAFYYVGTAEIDGVTYDKWRKIESNYSGEDLLGWDSDGKAYLYTNIIVETEEGTETTVTDIVGLQPDVANLAAWELKYCLDNDTSRFAWADEENGKGVIYYMKDEHNNECPYDFKNIQFKRMVSLENGYPEYDPENGKDTWVYTFCGNSYHIDNDEWSELKDGSLESPYGHQSDENTTTFNNNKIGEYRMLYDHENEDSTKCGKLYLNNNVFFGYWDERNSSGEEAAIYYAYCCYSNTFGNSCHSNTFNRSCYCNTFGNLCYSNTFDDDCSYNTFGNFCESNSFGKGCTFNSFGRSCYSNTFDDSCGSNTFGNDCNSNTFGNDCNSNTFGNDCYSNTFGNYCNYNTFGNDCNSNTFGNDCNSNTFGNDCNYNTFGNDCNYNTFGNDCYSNTFGTSKTSTISYVKYVRFENGCQNIKLLSSETGNTSNYVQDITVSAGVRGTSRNPRILNVSRNAAPVIYEAAGTTHIILD